MKTGFRGTFVISWSQTEVDGLGAAPRAALDLGVTWSWSGEAVRVDGPSSVLCLDQAGEAAAVRQSAARKIRRMVQPTPESGAEDPLFEAGFVVTDGRSSYAVTLIEVGPEAPPLLMFIDSLPPKQVELWVVHVNARAMEPAPRTARSDGVICFTPGTRIDTPDGPRAVEDLGEGDRVLTRDNGPQEILWIGRRRITGARMFVMPELRPIRIRPGALGVDRPDAHLLVSPAHRLLIRSRAAQELFNTPEVLVPARELINGGSIAPDLTVREVTYIHLLLPRHEVLWANGIETDSFHPAGADLTALSAEDADRLRRIDPSLAGDPVQYGGFARRTLTGSETAILMHNAA